MFWNGRAYWAATAAIAFSLSFAAAQENQAAAPDLAIAAGALVAAPAPEDAIDYFDKDTFSTRTIVCPFKGEVDYEQGDISCGLLQVPENREKKRPRKIELHYVKIAAREPDDWDTEQSGEWVKRDDPVIYLTGGPGAQVTGYVTRLKDHGIIDARDLYILEQRGIGYSVDFCPLYSNFDPVHANTPNWDDYQRAGLKSMEQCFAVAKAAKVDLSAYNSIENARDVEALRRALGLDQWNVWGISYGSILGQAYLKQDPGGIRAAVLDAIVPLQQDIVFHNIARYYDRALTILTGACNENPKCASAFPDFKERLESAILKASIAPIEIDAIDKDLFPTGKAYFFQDIAGGAPFVQFYEQDNYATLPAFIDAFVRLYEEENYEPFRLLTASGGDGGFGISQGMYNAIACNDGWHAGMKEAFEQDYADYPALAMVFGDPALVDDMARICKRYGMAPRPAEQYTAVQTDIRTLIVEGEMDPITPPPLAQAILPGFSNGTYVEFPFAGHGPTRSVECAGDFLNKFFDAPDGELDTSCVDEMKAPDFSGPLFETNALTKLAAMAAQDEKQLAVPALWFGLSAIILIFAAIIYTLAPVARAINGSAVHSTGGARIIAWFAALTGVTAIGGLGYAGYASFEANEFILLVGLLGWARWFVCAGLFTGILGVILLWRTIIARRREPLPIGVLSGLLLTSGAAIALAAFLSVWGFLPF